MNRSKLIDEVSMYSVNIYCTNAHSSAIWIMQENKWEVTQVYILVLKSPPKEPLNPSGISSFNPVQEIYLRLIHTSIMTYIGQTLTCNNL